jgi:hypothetical protein
MMYYKIVTAKQVPLVHTYENAHWKVLKTNAAI